MESTLQTREIYKNLYPSAAKYIASQLEGYRLSIKGFVASYDTLSPASRLMLLRLCLRDTGAASEILNSTPGLIAWLIDSIKNDFSAVAFSDRFKEAAEKHFKEAIEVLFAEKHQEYLDNQ